MTHHICKTCGGALIQENGVWKCNYCGNIYADEICFACGIRPRMNCRRVTKPLCESIVRETRRILEAAIQAGGTTIRSYTSSLGVTGLFQLSCMVHAQKNFAKGSSFLHLFGSEMKEQEGMSPNREPQFPFELGSYRKDEQTIYSSLY